MKFIKNRKQISSEKRDMQFYLNRVHMDTSLSVNVGYYTQVSGLGVLPTDTNINKLWVNADWMYHNATAISGEVQKIFQ